MNTVILKKKNLSFWTQEEEQEDAAVRINTRVNPYPDTRLNTLLIGYQYPLQSIDYIMFSAVTRISAVHFFVLKQLRVCLSE